MSTEKLEAEAFKLAPGERARLADRLLQSLEDLSDTDKATLWAQEAECRDHAWDRDQTTGRAAAAVLRDARDRLRRASG